MWRERGLISQMRREALEAPQRAAVLLQDDAMAIELGNWLRDVAPHTVATVARGSSDHAAQYFSYLTMLRLGIVTASLPMSLVTQHRAPLRCAGLLSVAFSQSGRSPDLIAPQHAVRDAGGHTLAVVNDAASPLAEACDRVLPIGMGSETSVAATKSYIGQLLAAARLIAHWQEDEELRQALRSLPDALQAACRHDWGTGLVPWLKGHERLFVIGRGLGLGIALEAALKFKEVSGIQAEAYSVAEVRHGPMALIDEGFPVLVFAPRGAAQTELIAFARQMRERGARVVVAAPAGHPDADLPLATAAHEDLDPIVAIQSFYLAVEHLACARGIDPDRPKFLQKVTMTV